jgi:mannosyltransferase
MGASRLTLPASPERAGPAATATAGGTAGPATTSVSRRRGGFWLAFGVPFLAELAVGGYQIGGASLWRDEGYTLEVAGRPVGAILSMMGREDAVHGFYYLLMHFVVAVAGTSAVALRLPSLLAMCVATGLTGGLGRRLAIGTGLPAPSLTGMLAGLLLVMYPLTTWYAQDARPYTLATLFAVAASWLLVSASSDLRWRSFVLYAVAIVLLGLFNLFALLIVAAHGISLLLARRPRTAVRASDGESVNGQLPSGQSQPGGPQPNAGVAHGRWSVELRWLAAVIGAGIVLSPYVVVAASQSGSLAWVKKPSIGVVLGLISDFSGSKYLFPVAGVLVAICVVAELGGRRMTGWTTASLAVPWLVLPPVVLLVVSLALPVYVERYVVFCMPATALLTAVGLVRLAQFVAVSLVERRGTASAGDKPAATTSLTRRGTAIVAGVLVLVVVAALAAVQAGPQHRARLTADRPDDLREVSQIVSANEKPGDGVIYLPWDSRVVGIAYPAPFARLSEIGQQQSPASSDTLRGTSVPLGVLVSRLSTVRRVWVVRWTVNLKSARVLAAEARLMPRLRLIRSWTVQSVVLSLYQVRSS